MSLRKSHEQFVSEMHGANPTLEITSQYVNNKKKVHYHCKVCGHDGSALPINLLKGHGCIKCRGERSREMFTYTQKQFEQLVYNAVGSEFLVCGTYKNSATDIEFLHVPCGGVFRRRPANFLSGSRTCPYCSGKRVLKGLNDLWTTNADMASLLVNPEIGYHVKKNSVCSVDMRCPYCGKVSHKRIDKVSVDNFPCPYCSPTYSFSERMMISILDQLGAKYLHDSATPWSQSKRYDFIIEGKIICEMHGIQHYKYSFTPGDSVEVQQSIDALKKEIALKNGINEYIIIDCQNSDFDYIWGNIEKSRFSELYDLSLVDIQKCKHDMQSRRTIRIAEMFNNGVPVGKIQKALNICQDTVQRALTNATQSGFCNYDPQENLRKSRYHKRSKV